MSFDSARLREVGVGWSLPRGAARRIVRTFQRWVVWSVFSVIATVIVGLWLRDGGITSVHDWASLFMSVGRITGLFGAYLLLVQLLLLARIPLLERAIGFDRLTGIHRANGKWCLTLILGHISFIITGYALADRLSIPAEYWQLLTAYNDMITATIGSLLIIGVAVSSLVIVRRRLRYETWYFVHLMAYLGVFLAWFHQIPSGNEFITNPLAAAFWTALYVVTLQLVILFRFGQPLMRALIHRLRVEEVMEEAPGVVSLRISGKHLSWLNARAGQFFLWRFLDRERWREAHPFSLSAAPDGSSLRITVKSLGDFSGRLGTITPGTRVMIEGPFGSFTDEARSRDRVALIAGGVGITPIRALLEEMTGNIVLVYRAVSEAELIFRHELEELARARHITMHFVLGDHRHPDNGHLMTSGHLTSLVPDLAKREVYLCGPPTMMRLTGRAVRRAGVPSRFIHTDNFAF
jgi:predicted ferric reductase